MIRVDMNRVMSNTTRFVLSAALALPLWGQEPIRGPMLGWVWDGRQESIRPILGIVGSSVLGKPLALEFPVKAAAISGRQEYALALGGDAREVFFLDLRAATPVVRKIDAPAGARRLALSPRGSAAVVSYDDPRRLVVLGGLDVLEPAVLRELDLSVEGEPASFAVSDNGSLVVAAYPEAKALKVFDESGNRWDAPKQGAISSAMFLEGSRDLLLGSEDGVFLIRDLAANATVQQVSTIPAAGAVAPIDAQRVLTIDAENQSVLELNLESGESRSVQCPCDPQRLVRMTRGPLFRLNDYRKSALWLVEISDTGLRTLFVPPDPSDPDLED